MQGIYQGEGKAAGDDACCGEHNHELSQEIVAMYPESKRLNEEEAREVEALLPLNVKPSTFTDYIHGTTGKCLTTQDLRNFSNRLAKKKGKSKDPTVALVQYMEELRRNDPEGKYIIGYRARNSKQRDEADKIQEGEEDQAESGEMQEGEDEECMVTYVLVQTSSMIESLKRFPELIIMDATYKVNRCLMPLLVVLVMDNFGHGRVVAYACLSSEDKELLSEVLLEVRASMTEEKASLTTTFIVDKSLSEIAAITKAFPEAVVQLCLYHVLKSFKRHVRDNPDIKSEKKDPDEVFSIMQELAYSRTSEKFAEIFLNLKAKAPESTVKYMEKNWIEKPEAWTHFERLVTPNFGQRTTNIAESKNGKIKNVYTYICSTVKETSI